MHESTSKNVFCVSCKQWLAHDTRRCPLFPKVEGTEKWSRCVCLIHTCFDNPEEVYPDDAPVYRDFP